VYYKSQTFEIQQLRHRGSVVGACVESGADGKYSVDGGGGLRVNRLSVYDNGTYECRAEVASHGNVKLRHVQLIVLCKNPTTLSLSLSLSSLAAAPS